MEKGLLSIGVLRPAKISPRPSTVEGQLEAISSRVSAIRMMARPLPRHVGDLTDDVTLLLIVTKILLVSAREQRPDLTGLTERVLRLWPLSPKGASRLGAFLDQIIAGEPDGMRVLSMVEAGE